MLTGHAADELESLPVHRSGTNQQAIDASITQKLGDVIYLSKPWKVTVVPTAIRCSHSDPSDGQHVAVAAEQQLP